MSIPTSPNLFFGMDTHFICGANARPDRREQMRLIRQTGFDAFHACVDMFKPDEKFDQLIAAQADTGVRLAGVYQPINIKNPPTDAVLAVFAHACARLPQATLVELALSHGEFGEAAGDSSKDELAMDWLRPIAAILRRLGLQGSLYPHFGFNVETCSDALRVAAWLDDPAIGVTFCAYHWFRVAKEPDLPSLLTAAAPSLRAVNLNGSRMLEPGCEVNGLNPTIDPLDVGVLPVTEILSLLRKLGYAGPLGVQGYGVDVPAAEALSRSLTVLRSV